MQDFVNYKNNYQSDVRDNENPLEWQPDIPSVMMGVLVGIFVAIMGFKVAEYRATQTASIETPLVEQIEDEPLVLDFYEALKVYEVLPRVLVQEKGPM